MRSEIAARGQYTEAAEHVIRELCLLAVTKPSYRGSGHNLAEAFTEACAYHTSYGVAAAALTARQGTLAPTRGSGPGMGASSRPTDD